MLYFLLFLIVFVNVCFFIICKKFYLDVKKSPTNEKEILIKEKNDLYVIVGKLETENTNYKERIDDILKNEIEIKNINSDLLKKNNEFISEISKANAENESYKKIIEEIKKEINEKNEKLTESMNKIKECTNIISKLETENDNYKKRIEEIKQESEEIKKNLIIQFQNLANNILEENSKKFASQNKENLDNILKPLSEKIKNFKEQLDVSNKNTNEQNLSLRVELQKTIALSNKLSVDTENLTKALKENTKLQGNWGEHILEKILENTGLRKDYDYVTQASFKTDEGKLYMPDIVINLPGEKHIIIDSKMSLNNYEQFFNSENEEEKKKQLKLHFDSVKKHVNELADKKYQFEYDNSGLDFVLMFIPIEQAYTLIIDSNQSIFEEAYRKNVVITSPSTLIPTLRIIANIWKKEKQNQNAMLIAQQAGALYDKFVNFINDLKNIGKQIDNTRNTYGEAMKKLCEGTGNLVTRVEKIKTLGAKVSKKLDQEMINSADL